MIPDYETNQDLDPIQDDVPINERTPRGLALRSSSDNEEPVELQGLDDLPLERSKYYALLNDMENGKSISIFCHQLCVGKFLPYGLIWTTLSFTRGFQFLLTQIQVVQ